MADSKPVVKNGAFQDNLSGWSGDGKFVRLGEDGAERKEGGNGVAKLELRNKKFVAVQQKVDGPRDDAIFTLKCKLRVAPGTIMREHSYGALVNSQTGKSMVYKGVTVRLWASYKDGTASTEQTIIPSDDKWETVTVSRAAFGKVATVDISASPGEGVVYVDDVEVIYDVGTSSR